MLARKFKAVHWHRLAEVDSLENTHSQAFRVSVSSPSAGGWMDGCGLGLGLSCRLLQRTIRRQHLFRAPGTDERKL